jgi:flagellar biosynthesis/type III secretory pathway M-ring protein FliF/YscJ
MTIGNAKVKSHTRTSKKGEVHTVKQHTRNYEMGSAMKEAFKGASPRKVAVASAALTVFSGLTYGLSTMMSIGASALWAVMIMCFAILTWVVMTKADRRRTRRELRHKAATSLKRRLRLMTHKTVRMPQKKKPLRAKKNKPNSW